MADLPSLNLLRTFDAVGRHMSFRAAAEELHVTASAVSHQIRDLEEYLGLPLFVRGARQVSFTPEGQQYHQQISPLLQQLRQATQSLLSRDHPLALRLSAIPYIATDVIAPELAAFQRQWPGLRVDVLGDTRAMNVEEGEADVAIRFGLDIHDNAIPLVPTQCTPLCAPEIAETVRNDPEKAFATFPVYNMSGYMDLWQFWLKEQGWRLPADHTTNLNSYRGLLVAASQGGICLGFLPVAVPWLERGELAMPFAERTVSLGQLSLEVRDGLRYQPEIQALIPWLRELFQSYQQRTDEFFSPPPV